MRPALRRCPACRSRSKADARYCASCGKEFDTERQDSSSILATVLIFVGTFVALLGCAIAAELFGIETLGALPASLIMSFMTTGSFVLFGLLALKTLGKQARIKSLGGRATATELALGLAGGVAAFACSFIYITVLLWLIDPQETIEFAEESLPLWSLLITMVLVPAVIEEWLDRGVLWVALEPIATPPVMIFSSALLFGMTHGLNGGEIFEVPHRFAAGLIFGWLRHRTGSLLPAIVAHGTLNTIAVLWPAS